MQGTVKCLSANRQRAAVLTDNGYTVFDIISGEVEPEDILSGDLASHGGVDLANLTSGRTISVFVEAIHATQAAVRSLLG